MEQAQLPDFQEENCNGNRPLKTIFLLNCYRHSFYSRRMYDTRSK